MLKCLRESLLLPVRPTQEGVVFECIITDCSSMVARMGEIGDFLVHGTVVS